MFISGGIMAGAMFIFPLFVRVSLGWTPLQTGLFLMYFAFSATIGILISRTLLESGVNAKIMMIAGLLLMSGYLFMLSFSTPDTPPKTYILPLILGGIGATAFMLPIMSLSVGGLRGADLAQGTGLSNMLKRLGNAIGIAVINIYLDHQNVHVYTAMSTYISHYNPISNELYSAALDGGAHRNGVPIRVTQRDRGAIQEADFDGWGSAERKVLAGHARHRASLPGRFARRPLAIEAAIVGGRLMKARGEHGDLRRPGG